MYFSSLLTAAVAAASFAIAAPAPQTIGGASSDTSGGGAAAETTGDNTPGQFLVTDFKYHCDAKKVCRWSLKVATTDGVKHHPAMLTPVSIQGDVNKNKDYVLARLTGGNVVKAYIEVVKDVSTLKLGYDVTIQSGNQKGSIATYFGERVVRVDQEVAQFTVEETSSIGVPPIKKV